MCLISCYRQKTEASVNGSVSLPVRTLTDATQTVSAEVSATGRRSPGPVYSPKQQTKYSSSTAFTALFLRSARRILKLYEKTFVCSRGKKQKRPKLRQSFRKIPSIVGFIMTQSLHCVCEDSPTCQTGVSGSGAEAALGVKLT